MSIRLRSIMAEGTPRAILRALRDKKTTPDHEDMVLGLSTALELIDELCGELADLKTRLENPLVRVTRHKLKA